MKKSKFVLLFISGLLCFYVSQVMLRLPLINALGKKPSVVVFFIKYGLLWGVFLALTAGIFEEGFRFLFVNFFYKRTINCLLEPILFGLGHSVMEIVFLFYPVIRNGGFRYIGAFAVLERLLATVFHIELSILIWNGFYRGKKLLFLFLAVFLHFVVDFFIPIGRSFHLSAVQIELVFSIFCVLIAALAVKLNKLEVKP